MVFDIDLYKVKALTLPPDFIMDDCKGDEKVICGFLHNNGNSVFVKNDVEDTRINPSAICRNTGVKVKGIYLYENDLVKHGSGINNAEIGIVVWGEFEKGWCIQSNANYSGRSPLGRKNIIDVIGNFALSKDDADMFQKYSDDEDAKYSGIGREPECRSAAHINKLAKQFLPR
jgi:hypothetical protein